MDSVFGLSIFLFASSLIGSFSSTIEVLLSAGVLLFSVDGFSLGLSSVFVSFRNTKSELFASMPLASSTEKTIFKSFVSGKSLFISFSLISISYLLFGTEVLS